MADNMFSRFERSCRLIGTCWDVLRSDRELLILPALSGVATALIVAVFFVPAAREPDALLYLSLFLFYIAQYSIVIFFNTALVGAALSAVYQAAVYYYAVADEPPRGFDRDLVRGAFGPKRGASS